MQKNVSTATFSSPFSLDYWRCAVAEFHSLRSLIFAALLIALRVAVKAFSIPVAPDLTISFGFFFNAVGSAVYGPIVGLMTGAITDTLGAFFFPKGPYFFPFIIEEMLGSFLFGLFLYRSKVTSVRVILSRFAVSVLNILLNPLLMLWMNTVLYGESYKLLSLHRVIKNLTLFPLQSLLLLLFFGTLLPILKLLKIGHFEATPLKIRKRDIVLLVVLTVIAVAVVVLYMSVYLPYHESTK